MPSDPSINQNPEQIARDEIDQILIQSGWVVQSKKEINFNASLGVAIREYQTDSGPADYVLFVDSQAIGIIEAKPESWGERLTVVEEQSSKYANAKLKYINNKPLRFIYESTGTITRFTDNQDPTPRSREIFSFQHPKTLQRWLSESKSFRGFLQNLPALSIDGLRDCQINAINNLENSLKKNYPRALIQMATGSGKTFTAITSSYRLLKYAKAHRILFLVNTKQLGEQAEQEFLSYIPNDDSRKFSELYNVLRLKNSSISTGSQIYISTIQRLYSVLKDEPLDERLDEQNPFEQYTRPKEPMPVVFNEKLPPDFFDVIFIDECHESIYNLWRQVVEYFDAFLVGLTATPDNRTYGFFQKNVVSEYDHEKAVADGVNVGNEVFLIDTRISQQGGSIKKNQLVEKRIRQTRKKRWESQDTDTPYSQKELDRSVVNVDQIRTVIRAYRDNLPVIFPARQEVPKTLIFAKTDSHADDIINIVREEFAQGNEFCKKVTYRTANEVCDENGNIISQGEDPKSVLANFRTSYHPRIAVTVDMIATGTDVKPLECLVFMRDVRSKNYFEQMKGRGTRTLDHDSLKKVTPSAISAKTHYVIVDAVGVTKSIKTASRPLDSKPTISLKDLAMGVLMGANDSETVASLAGRLARLNQQLNEKEQGRIKAVSGGVPLKQIVSGLLFAINDENVENKAREDNNTPADQEPNEEELDTAQAQLVRKVAKVLTGKLIELVDNIRRDKEQTVIHDEPDELINATWQGDSKENAKQLTQEFAEYLQSQIDEINALEIYFRIPARRSEVSFEDIRGILDKLKNDRPKLAPMRIWQAYALLDEYQGAHPTAELTALVALIRRVCGMDEKITPYDLTVRKNFQSWILKRHSGAGEKFNEAQMAWLHQIRDHISNSFHIERDDLENPPFGQGGLGKMYQLFGENMDALIQEINRELVA